MTDPAIIAASYAAERNYSHNPDDVINASDAVGAWGTAKESTTELVDLSGNENVADIHGAMPTEGFIQGRRFKAANANYLDCGNDSSLDITNTIMVEALIKTDGINVNAPIVYIGTYHSFICLEWAIGSKLYMRQRDNAGFDDGAISSISPIGDKWYHIVGVIDGRSTNGMRIYINGYLDGTLDNSACTSPTVSHIYIGKSIRYLKYLDSLIGSININKHVPTDTEIKQRFNTIVCLPFWSVNYTDYPDNVAEYTDNLPYSSSIISSGTFKVDDDKLQCVSAGTITYSASYEFDGSEYIKVEIGGVEYAGTGTITQGNTTVSVAQGSNKVTIEMGTGDKIDDEINIQFRKEV